MNFLHESSSENIGKEMQGQLWWNDSSLYNYTIPLVFQSKWIIYEQIMQSSEISGGFQSQCEKSAGSQKKKITKAILS